MPPPHQTERSTHVQNRTCPFVALAEGTRSRAIFSWAAVTTNGRRYPPAAGSLLDGRPGNPVERRRDGRVGDEPRGGGRGDRVRAWSAAAYCLLYYYCDGRRRAGSGGGRGFRGGVGGGRGVSDERVL